MGRVSSAHVHEATLDLVGGAAVRATGAGERRIPSAVPEDRAAVVAPLARTPFASGRGCGGTRLRQLLQDLPKNFL